MYIYTCVSIYIYIYTHMIYYIIYACPTRTRCRPRHTPRCSDHAYALPLEARCHIAIEDVSLETPDITPRRTSPPMPFVSQTSRAKCPM